MSEHNKAVTSEAAVREMRATLRANSPSAPAAPAAMAAGVVAVTPRTVPDEPSPKTLALKMAPWHRQHRTP